MFLPPEAIVDPIILVYIHGNIVVRCARDALIDCNVLACLYSSLLSNSFYTSDRRKLLQLAETT